MWIEYINQTNDLVWVKIFLVRVRVGTGGYGVVNGKDNGVYYNFNSGNATIRVTNTTSGGMYSIFLYKGNSILPVWKQEYFNGLPTFNIRNLSSGSNYWFKIVAEGTNGRVYNFSATVSQ